MRPAPGPARVSTLRLLPTSLLLPRLLPAKLLVCLRLRLLLLLLLLRLLLLRLLLLRLLLLRGRRLLLTVGGGIRLARRLIVFLILRLFVVLDRRPSGAG